MAMTTADAKYVERALRDFFGLAAKKVNVTEDAVEGSEDKPEREYILHVKEVVTVDGKQVKRDKFIGSVAEAIAYTSAE